MKKFLLLLTVIIFSKVEAQFFSGEIVIKDQSIYYLNQIYVTNVTSHNTVYTDYFGTFKIPAKVGDIIRFTSTITDRTDIKITNEQLQASKNFVELKVAYYDIQEVIVSKFKPTGNLRKDVTSLKNGEKMLALQKMIGLPMPKGDGTPPLLPPVGFGGGGLNFNIGSIYDIFSGERKKQERAKQYEIMSSDISNIRNYYGTAYFNNLKIPTNLIDNFLQFVYTSDDITTYIKTNNYEAVGIYIDKYLPIYQRRLRNSSLLDISN